MSDEQKTPETVPDPPIEKSDPIKHPDEAINLPIKEVRPDTSLEVKEVKTKTTEEPKKQDITPVPTKKGRGRPKKILTEEEKIKKARPRQKPGPKKKIITEAEQIKIDKEKAIKKETLRQFRINNLAKGRDKAHAKIKENKAKRDAEKKKKNDEERALILLGRDTKIRAQRKAKRDKKKLEEIEAKLEEPTETELELEDTRAELQKQTEARRILQQEKDDEIEDRRLMAEEIKNQELESIRKEEELRNRIRPMRSKRRAYRYL